MKFKYLNKKTHQKEEERVEWRELDAVLIFNKPNQFTKFQSPSKIGTVISEK